MPWFPLALLTAGFESAKDVAGKLALARSDALAVNLAWRLLALPVLLPVLAVTGIPPLGPGFWEILAAGAALNLVAGLLYMRALQLGELSLTVPLVNLTPALLLLTSPLLVGETPSPAGLAGVLLVVVGALWLQRPSDWRDWRCWWRNPGSRLMVLVALIWSVTANLDKLGLRRSSPIFWAVAIDAGMVLGLALLFAATRRRRQTGPLPWTSLAATGLCGGLTQVCQMLAIGLTQVPYVIAVKRTSTVFAVLWGRLLFGEGALRRRLPAVLVMFAGVLLIVLS